MAITRVTTDGITDNAVSTAKIGANAVDTTKIGADVIVADDIADNAITVAQIQDGAVTAAKLNSAALNPITLDQTNNSVGIGTSSPSTSHRLTLDKSSNYGGISFNQNGNQVGQIIQEGGTGNVYIDADSNSLGGGLIFRTTSGTTRMTIDGSGRVTTPNQPGWHGTHTDNYATTYSNGTVHNMVSGQTNSYNVGNHFDYSTDRFTVPVTGYYLLYGWDIRENGTTATGCAVGAWKNGIGGSYRIVSNYHQNDRAYAFTTIAYLAVNDWVSFGCTEGGGVAGLFYGSADYSGYGIRLLG